MPRDAPSLCRPRALGLHSRATHPLNPLPIWTHSSSLSLILQMNSFSAGHSFSKNVRFVDSHMGWLTSPRTLSASLTLECHNCSK